MKRQKKQINNILQQCPISQTQYMWHSEKGENTCQTCSSLDQRVFNIFEQIPDEPHPNCKCSLDPICKIFIMPCHGDISSPYGWRIHPIYNKRIFHNGWDIKVPVGAPIQAIYSGKVIYSGTADGYGKWVVIDHGKINGKIVTSEYGHLSSCDAKVGQQVETGEQIGKSGNTGTSTGPHLHITVRTGKFQGAHVNPSEYINTTKGVEN